MIIDNAVADVRGHLPYQLGSDIISSGVLNWGDTLPAQLSDRLANDLGRIQDSQPPVLSDRPRFPYTMEMLNASNRSGVDEMSRLAELIVGTLLSGRMILGHGLLSFAWQFFRVFLESTIDADRITDDMLLSQVYDTANIERVIQEDHIDFMPAPSATFASWQRLCGVMSSKSKWSLRSSMFSRYGLQLQPGRQYFAADMLEEYGKILEIWGNYAR